MKKISAFVYSIYGYLYLFLSLLIVTPLYAIILAAGGEQAERKAHRLSQLWAKSIFIVLLIRLKIYGRDKLDMEQNYVFVSNHRSFLDIPVCALLTRHFFKFLAKEELTKVPLLGWIISRLYLTVNRSSTREKVKSMVKMKELVKAGGSLWLYPEGTRKKGELGLLPFQDGAFWTAIETQTPIAVAFLKDTARLLPSDRKFYLLPGTVRAYWVDVIPTAGMTKADIPVLAERVRQSMANALDAKEPLN